jgi:hypothetical protein
MEESTFEDIEFDNSRINFILYCIIKVIEFKDSSNFHYIIKYIWCICMFNVLKYMN